MPSGGTKRKRLSLQKRHIGRKLMAEEEKEFNISPKIEELQKKLDKDPDSKIFLPLAEEYRKSGMPEEAIAICQEGLKKQPNYMSARVVLGRAYMELKKMIEAQAEFEEVISKIPDNLMANKYLGDIYFMQGNLKNAVERYQMVIRLDPSNEEVASKIKDISEKLDQQIPIPVSPEEVPGEPPSPPSEEEEQTEALPEERPKEEEHQEEPSEKKPEEEEKPSHMTIDLTEEESSVPIPEERPEEPQPQPLQPPLPLQEESSFHPPAAEESTPIPSEPKLPAIDEEKSELTTATIAELYAKQGLFDKALKLYNQLLEANPGNMELKFRYDQLLDRKKEEETKKKEAKEIPSAMKKEEEAIRRKKIETLNKWLEALKKKRPPHPNPDV